MVFLVHAVFVMVCSIRLAIGKEMIRYEVKDPKLGVVCAECERARCPKIVFSCLSMLYQRYSQRLPVNITTKQGYENVADMCTR